jgi:hypothetical protein
MHRTHLHPLRTRRVQPRSERGIAAAGAFAGGEIDEIGAAGVKDAPVDRGVMLVDPGALHRIVRAIGHPGARLPPAQADGDHHRQQQCRQPAPQRRFPRLRHEPAPNPVFRDPSP